MMKLFRSKQNVKASNDPADEQTGVDLSEEQMNSVSGGDRGGHHKPPQASNPFSATEHSLF